MLVGICDYKNYNVINVDAEIYSPKLYVFLFINRLKLFIERMQLIYRRDTYYLYFFIPGKNDLV
jgi:hypothetical protein